MWDIPYRRASPNHPGKGLGESEHKFRAQGGDGAHLGLFQFEQLADSGILSFIV
jgi:hypothetical protein